jgi:hypothetical protein
MSAEGGYGLDIGGHAGTTGGVVTGDDQYAGSFSFCHGRVSSGGRAMGEYGIRPGVGNNKESEDFL